MNTLLKPARSLVLWVALAVPAVASAGPLGPRGPIDEDRVMERLDRSLDAIDASDAQRASAREIIEQTLPEMQAFRDEGNAIREDVRAAFEGEQVDRIALEDARQDLVGLFDRATGTFFAMIADVADLFTVEQRAELRAQREARRAQWRKRLGFGD
ncbi:MAG: Spy/CpxP family protein refolding chaperone [Myxococcota bacterium]